MGTRSIQKITVNLPKELLAEVRQATGSGITATLIEGLKELQRKQLRRDLLRLRGKVDIDLDLDRTRR